MKYIILEALMFSERRVSFILLLTLCSLLSNSSFGQRFNEEEILNSYGLEKFMLKDDIYLLSKGRGKCPTIIFIHGSGFNPLIVNGFNVMTPFSLEPYKEKFNFVVASKPGIPIMSDSLQNKYINHTYKEGVYVGNDFKVPQEYLKRNNLEEYIDTFDRLVDFLSQQDWVSKDEIYVVGHSQGLRVATEIGVKNKNVSKVALMSSFYENRFIESIKQIRTSQFMNRISPIDAQTKIDSIYVRYSELVLNKDNNKDFFDSNTFLSYFSFTSPSNKERILLLDKPTLVVYGTSSLQDSDLDYLPLDIIRLDKKNIEVKPFIGMDHNYFSYEFKDGKWEQIFNWDEVFNEVISWLTDGS